MKVNYSKFEKINKAEIAKIEKLLKLALKGREPKSLYEPCSYILEGGGKRIRPFLVLVSAKAVNGNYKKVYNAAVSVELLHNFTLAHDDVMDNSDKRRGRLTLHKKYDLSTAILAGDSLLALAYQILLKDLNQNTAEVVATFTKGLVEVCEGQGYDKEFETRRNVSLNEYKKMIYKKTAALMEMCCAVGAQSCNASNQHVKAVSNYGKYLGMAFQIQDDLLDIIADEIAFGKAIGSDLVEGKKTFLFLRALEKAEGKEKKELLRVIDEKGIRKNEIEKFRKIYLNLGVIKDAEHQIMKYIKLAIKNISSLPDSEGKFLLYWMASALVNRKK